MDGLEAADWLRLAERTKREARRRRRAFWFPLVLFGIITLLAAPLYRLAPGHHLDPMTCC
jgi:hypothetical protein